MALYFLRPPSMAMYVALVFCLSLLLLSRNTDVLPALPHRPLQMQVPLNRSYVGKVSMLYGDNPVYEQALKTHDKHNRAHGYEMTVLRRQLLPGFWSKPAYILSRLLEELAKPEDERLEWIVWFDIDILIMNYKIPLEIFLPPPETYPGIICLVTDDHRGLNNGVFFIRVNDLAVYLMTAVLGYQKAGCRPPGRLRTEDQGALENIIKEDQFRDHVMHLPQRWFNAFTGYRDPTLTMTTKFKANSVKEGDLLVHFAGHKDTREATMKKWLELYHSRRGAWEIDLKDTGYEEEIQRYWEEDAEKENPKAERYFPGTSAMLD